MAVPQQFKCYIGEERLAKLQKRLELTELPSELEGVEPWTRGTPLSEIHRLHEYWMRGFDWRKAGRDINLYPQFISEIEVEGFGAQSVHFMHVKSNNEHAIPLLFVHGWRGSFHEASKIVPLLTVVSNDFPSFHVVAPSLPSFGFSGSVQKKGFHSGKHAEALHKLMLSLGYTQYVTQGGDVGHSVTRMIAYSYPEHCKAHHLNMVVASQPSEDQFPQLVEKIKKTSISEQEQMGLDRSQKFFSEGMAYALMHAQRPQTIAYSMVDSPIGLLAWIYEKLHAWTDAYPWTDDEILTWVCTYYFSTAGPHAPAQWYHENYYSECVSTVTKYIDVKLGVSRFPLEIVQMPRLWAHTLGPIVFERNYDAGGHFAAWERPQALVDDLREMFGKNGGAFGCVVGKSGYKTG
ncbi:hypothetical protein Z517_05918 [Fonsecaea pedrosoi CBS 271.37]|uniref:Epoxide hydrolase N-terminal domain-containing protein n=1 Tax=Fonsecaea pedrosoi CBS 271.37 TaxID=1442368 RepID=A0A0D2DNJ2_9EURO|nr:uncharacterized protein Z517_05918 [Fonsecaea pedrosoi CBS 271.37]KIW79306.1 hypothetical protein Z517_05918 [Fonsecaea pedrosoi CBS 271.37]